MSAEKSFETIAATELNLKLVYVDKESEKLAKEVTVIAPVTIYTPKDKVSKKFRRNEIKFSNPSAY